MPRAETWEKYEEAELAQVVDQRNKKVPWTEIERWWRKNVGTTRGKQAIRSKMERWQLKEKIRELSARQSVHQAEGAPPVPRRVEGGLGKDKVLGVRSPSLVGKPYRKTKRLKRRSEWSVPSSPEPMAIVKGPSKSLRRESKQGCSQGSAIGIPAPSTPIAAGESDLNLREPARQATEKPKEESRNDDYGLIKSCVAYLTLTMKLPWPEFPPLNVMALPHRPRRRSNGAARPIYS